MIYTHDTRAVSANLFIASELEWPEHGFALHQKTRFPDETATALDENAIAALATAKPDIGALGVDTKPAFAGVNHTLDGTKPVVTPQNVGISGNPPWTISVWVKGDVGHASPDDFGLGILGWGNPSPNAGNFLYHRPEGETVFGFYSNDDRAPTGESAVTRSIVWLPEPKQSGSSEGAALWDSP